MFERGSLTNHWAVKGAKSAVLLWQTRRHRLRRWQWGLASSWAVFSVWQQMKPGGKEVKIKEDDRHLSYCLQITYFGIWSILM